MFLLENLACKELSFPKTCYALSLCAFLVKLRAGECQKTSLMMVNIGSGIVMAWRHQTASHYLNQYCPISVTPYGVTRPKLTAVYIEVCHEICLFEKHSSCGLVTRHHPLPKPDVYLSVVNKAHLWIYYLLVHRTSIKWQSFVRQAKKSILDYRTSITATWDDIFYACIYIYMWSKYIFSICYILETISSNLHLMTWNTREWMISDKIFCCNFHLRYSKPTTQIREFVIKLLIWILWSFLGPSKISLGHSNINLLTLG